MAVDLIVKKRNLFGRKTKELRHKDVIPAELYGKGIENIHLSVPKKELVKTIKEAGQSTIINLDIEGEKRPVLIYEIQRHPVSNDIMAVDFYQVRLDEQVETAVPVELINEAPAVKEKDGVLVQVMQEVNIKALPTNIPRSIEVDISCLKDIDQSIHIRDIKLPEGVKILDEADAVVVTVKPQITEEEEKALEEEESRAEAPAADKEPEDNAHQDNAEPEQ